MANIRWPAAVGVDGVPEEVLIGIGAGERHGGVGHVREAILAGAGENLAEQIVDIQPMDNPSPPAHATTPPRNQISYQYSW